MDLRVLAIALAFAALAAGFVALGLQGQERRAAARAEQAAALAAAPEAPGGEAKSPALVWLQGDLASEDRLAIAMLCAAAAGAAWLWLLFMAFSESLAWGFVVLLGNLLGAIAFSVFGSRRSMAPLFIMTSAYGLLFLLR